MMSPSGTGQPAPCAGRHHPWPMMMMIAQLLLVPGADSFSTMAPSPRPRPTSIRMAPDAAAAAAAGHGRRGAQLVWFTGSADLRVGDHGGLLDAIAAAAAADAAVVPVFVIDPAVHLRCRPPHLVRRLHAALVSLEDELLRRHRCTLVVRRGDAAELLPKLAENCGATVCHVVVDDVCHRPRGMMTAGCLAMERSGLVVRRWDNALRDGAADPAACPPTFPEYARAVGTTSPRTPVPDGRADGGWMPPAMPLAPPASEGVPSLEDLLDAVEAATPRAAKVARDLLSRRATMPPYEEAVVRWCNESSARAALLTYVVDGRDAFADAYLGDALGSGTDSLEAAAAQRLVAGCARPSEGLALREAATRAFSPAISLGVLSPREVLAAAREASIWPLSPDDRPWWGRSSLGALHDVVEWREWFDLLARRSLALQARGGANPVAAQGSDERSRGLIRYWRWQGAYLVRYLFWPAGERYDGTTPALLLVHGFAASSEQWERLVHSLRELGDPQTLPPIYALDLVGFGHSEKPGISYTQYTWEAQLVDFAVEVLEGAPVVLAGNSIGGGLVAGAASTLGEQVRGVVLCNTAGVLDEPEGYDPPAESVRDSTLRGAVKPYSPVPLLGQPVLDLFGEAVIGLIFPQIPTRLADIYADRPANADLAVTFAIQQGAASPGSANVIGSGQKLAPNRPLNEVLNRPHGFGGPVLVAQGRNDRVSGPARAQERAQLFKRLRPGITVRELDAGHCPHDEVPEQVAEAILQWLPNVVGWK